MDGWILLLRKFLEWEWYNDTNTKSLFIHCLLKANYKDKSWRGIHIKRGQFFTSIKHLSVELNLSVKAVRISIDKLKNTGEIVTNGASNGTMITVCNYAHYQDYTKDEGQTKGKEGAKEGQLHNKENKENKSSIPPKEEPKRINYEELVSFFHTQCSKLPKVRSITDARKRAIKARLNEHGKDGIKLMIENAALSDFLNGKNDRNWTADFDWLFKPSNFVKVLEGNYTSKETDNSIPQSSLQNPNGLWPSRNRKKQLDEQNKNVNNLWPTRNSKN